MTWKVRKLRAVAEVALGRQRSPQYADGPHMRQYLRAANVKDGILDLSSVLSMNFSPQEQELFSLRYGDVLVSEGSGSLNSVGASAVWRSEIEGAVCFQNTLLRLRPREGTDPEFLGWWTRYVYGSGIFASIATGANIYHIGAERVRALSIDLPALEEQRRIADFLDAETALIDRVIEKMRTQLSLLEERDLADVHAAVSGARISGERKAVGIDWLGEVPVNWSVTSVSSQFQVQLGKMLNQERARGSRLRPYLRVLNVQRDRIDVTELVEMDFPEAERARYEVLPGDLLICEGGSPGRAAVWDGRVPEIFYQKALHRARSRGRSSVRWLYYCLRLAQAMGVFHAEGNSSTITHLTGEQLASRRFPFPDPEVQEKLVAELDAEGQNRALLREARERQVRVLEERRRALITAAVTGQIDVTAARGPEFHNAGSLQR